MKRWKIGKSDDSKVAEFLGKCDIGKLALEILSSRGCNDFQQVVDYFTVSELEDPFAVKDMREAADVINKAVDAFDLICIYGDYDCDGVTSTAILYSYLMNIGADVMYYIPEREAGYGLNMDAVDQLAAKGVKLIITVDNGISAIEEARRIYELGMRLVVTDHHQPGDILPRAEAVVDPHRNDCHSKFKDLCGAGVALKLCAALDGGEYDAVLEQYSDICAIGTVADVVSLTGENRTLVKTGLRYLPNTEVYGLDMLLDRQNIDRSDIRSDSISFRIAPVINASGRFGSPITAVQALLSDDRDDAESCVEMILRLNGQRKETEGDIMTQIAAAIDNDPHILDHRAIVVAGKGWHHGVIGIVAARLLDQYSKPVIVISIEDNGEARGSARSVRGFNIFDCLCHCKKVLTKFGGHECAGGFSLREEDIGEFTQLVYEFAQGLEKVPAAVIKADKQLSPADLTVDAVKSLSVLEPTGAGNEKPIFAMLGAVIDRVVPLSQGKHTRLEVRYGGARAQAVMFGVQTASLNYHSGDRLDMLVDLSINSFGGKESVSVRVIDHRLSGVKQEPYFAAKDAYERLRCAQVLPESFIRKIIPDRRELVTVYKYIFSVKQASLDDIFMRIGGDAMYYCKLRICVDIFADKGLVSYTPSTMMISYVPVDRKVDLEDSDTLRELRAMLEGGQKA